MLTGVLKTARGAAHVLCALAFPLVMATAARAAGTTTTARGSAARPAAVPAAQVVRPGPAPTDSTPGQAVPLKAVEVTATVQSNGYSQPRTLTATRTDTPVLDVPQSIHVIPRQVLVDQGAQSLADAVRNAPGVYVQQGEGNRDEFYLRGVKTKSDFFVDGLRDDTEYFRPLYNVAHVDVLEGPAAVLFGRGGAGGIINLVTKKPVRAPIRNLTVEAGSWREKRGTVDVGDALGASAAWRVMAMAERSGSFRDHYFLHRHAVNPKLTVDLGAATTLDVSASFLNDRRRADRGVPSRNGRPAPVPRDAFFGSPAQNVANSRVSAFDVRLHHQFNDALELRNAFLVTRNHRMYENVYPGSPLDDQGQLKLKAYHHPTDRLSYLDRLEVVADFTSGAVEHKLLVGTALSWQRGNDMQTLPGPSKTLPGIFSASSLHLGPVAFPELDRNNHVVGREWGLYAEDQASWSEHWKALVGVRWDRFSVSAHYDKPGVTPDYTYRRDTDVSPRAGLIYKPVDNDSLYASVTRTWTPQGANIALSQKSPETANLAPEQATNYEIGNKLDLAGGRLAITAAWFLLDLEDVVSPAADGSGRLVNTGAQRNRGVALSVHGELTQRWSVYANYTHLNARITRATQDAAAGARVGLVPRDQFSIWARYSLDASWGFGGGVHGAARKYTSYDDAVVLPGFVVAELMAWYEAARWRVQLNLDNVTDRAYYPTASGDDQIMPGAPRHVNLSVSFRF